MGIGLPGGREGGVLLAPVAAGGAERDVALGAQRADDGVDGLLGQPGAVRDGLLRGAGVVVEHIEHEQAVVVHAVRGGPAVVERVRAPPDFPELSWTVLHTVPPNSICADYCSICADSCQAGRKSQAVLVPLRGEPAHALRKTQILKQ